MAKKPEMKRPATSGTKKAKMPPLGKPMKHTGKKDCPCPKCK